MIKEEGHLPHQDKLRAEAVQPGEVKVQKDLIEV